MEQADQGNNLPHPKESAVVEWLTESSRAFRFAVGTQGVILGAALGCDVRLGFPNPPVLAFLRYEEGRLLLRVLAPQVPMLVNELPAAGEAALAVGSTFSLAGQKARVLFVAEPFKAAPPSNASTHATLAFELPSTPPVQPIEDPQTPLWPPIVEQLREEAEKFQERQKELADLSEALETQVLAIDQWHAHLSSEESRLQERLAQLEQKERLLDARDLPAHKPPLPKPSLEDAALAEETGPPALSFPFNAQLDFAQLYFPKSAESAPEANANDSAGQVLLDEDATIAQVAKQSEVADSENTQGSDARADWPEDESWDFLHGGTPASAEAAAMPAIDSTPAALVDSELPEPLASFASPEQAPIAHEPVVPAEPTAVALPESAPEIPRDPKPEIVEYRQPIETIVSPAPLAGTIMGDYRIVDGDPAIDSLLEAVHTTTGQSAIFLAKPAGKRPVALHDESPAQERTASSAWETLIQLEHENIAPLAGLLDHENRTWGIWEMPQGRRVDELTRISPALGIWYRLFLQAALGLRALHQAGLVHGAIGPGSFVLQPSGMLTLCPVSPLHADGDAAAHSALIPKDLNDLGTLGWRWLEKIFGEREKGDWKQWLPATLWDLLQRLESAGDGFPKIEAAEVLAHELDRLGLQIRANPFIWASFLDRQFPDRQNPPAPTRKISA